MPLGKDEDPVTPTDPVADVVQDRRKPTSMIRERTSSQDNIDALVRERIRGPQHAPLAGRHLNIANAAIRRSRQIKRVRTQGSHGIGRGAGHSVVPGRLQELLGRPHKILSSRPHALGIAHQHHGAVGEHLNQQPHVIGQHGGKGLHPVDGDALCHTLQNIGRAGMQRRQGACTSAHIIRQE